jgi:uncharacterized protein YraI
MCNLKALSFLAMVLATLPAASHAVLAYAAKDVNMRAGPARDYPVVAILPPGAALSVEACLGDYRWCDVVAGPNRGWVYAGNIVYPYQGEYVPLISYGAALGIGVTAFFVGSYWDSYYVGRTWYPQRNYWVARPWPGYRPGGYPPRPGYRPPGGYPPPPGVRPPGGQPPPPVVLPPGAQSPKPVFRQPGGHPPSSAGGVGNQRAPQAPGGGQRPSQGPGPGGGPRP